MPLRSRSLILLIMLQACRNNRFELILQLERGSYRTPDITHRRDRIFLLRHEVIGGFEHSAKCGELIDEIRVVLNPPICLFDSFRDLKRVLSRVEDCPLRMCDWWRQDAECR